MLNKALFVAFCLLLVQKATSQAPGYLGKRLVFGLDLQGMAAMNGPTAANYGAATFNDQHSKIGLNTRFGATAGYAISRKKQLVFGADFLKTGSIGHAQTASLFVDFVPDNHQLFYNLKSTSVSVGYRNFRLQKGAIAPLGKYGGWSLSWMRTTGEILDKQTIFGSGLPETQHGKLGIDSEMNTFWIAYDGGTTYVLADKLLLSVGGRFAFPINVAQVRNLSGDGFSADEYEYAYDELGNVDYTISNKKAFLQMATTRLFWHSWLTMRIGVGYLF